MTGECLGSDHVLAFQNIKPFLIADFISAPRVFNFYNISMIKEFCYINQLIIVLKVFLPFKTNNELSNSIILILLEQYLNTILKYFDSKYWLFSKCNNGVLLIRFKYCYGKLLFCIKLILHYNITLKNIFKEKNWTE